MDASETTSVREQWRDAERLHTLALSRGVSVGDIVHAALDALDALDVLEKQEFLHGLTADYARLREDPERWEQCVAERQ